MNSVLSSILLIVPLYSFAQPEVEWYYRFGTSGSEQFDTFDHGGSGFPSKIVRQTTDSGYIVATEFWNHCHLNGDINVVIVKHDLFGNPEWSKCFGGTMDEMVSSLVLTNDGGYLLAGSTSSNDGDVSGNHGLNDGWIFKLDNYGNMVWQKCIGGSNNDGFNNISHCSDGCFLLAGFTRSIDGDVIDSDDSNDDTWLLKIDSLGNVLWQHCIGTNNTGYGFWNQFSAVIETTDNGLIAVGGLSSFNSEITDNHGGMDGFVVKLNSSGELEWNKCFGGSGDEYINSIMQTQDGGYIFVGNAGSIDGDVVGLIGGGDIWVVKIDPFGVIEWQKCMGTENNEAGTGIIQSQLENGYYILGSYSGLISDEINQSCNNSFLEQYSILHHIGLEGEDNWYECIGFLTGFSFDALPRSMSQSSVDLTSDGGLIIGNSQFLSSYELIKFGYTNASMNSLSKKFITIFPNPTNSILTFELDASELGSCFVLSDLFGKEIINGKVTSIKTTIDLTAIPAGIYILSINNGITTKVVKE